jgi:sugar/nucleoside kinase (ribokinase family)
MMLYGFIRDKQPHVYVSATDSMINSIGRGMVNCILKESELYVAGLAELQVLLGRTVKSYTDLNDMMTEVQKNMNIDCDCAVFVTYDDKGAFLLYDGTLYHHPVAKITDPLGFGVINSSGCGDAFAAVAAVLYLLRAHGLKIDPKDILGYASIAGQIKATTVGTACGAGMACQDSINDFLKGEGNFERMANEYAVRMVSEYKDNWFVPTHELRLLDLRGNVTCG